MARQVMNMCINVKNTKPILNPRPKLISSASFFMIK